MDLNVLAHAESYSDDLRSLGSGRKHSSINGRSFLRAVSWDSGEEIVGSESKAVGGPDARECSADEDLPSSSFSSPIASRRRGTASLGGRTRSPSNVRFIPLMMMKYF